jgi:hypothetical protein
MLLTSTAALLAYMAFRRWKGDISWRLWPEVRRRGDKLGVQDLVRALLGLSLFVLIVTIFVADFADEAKARRWVLSQLASEPRQYQVWIEDREVADPVPVVTALRGLSHVGAHHSAPTKPLQIRVAHAGHRLDLVVARDSTLPSEYWVFLPGKSGGPHGSLLGQQAGRISTSVFDTTLK